MSDPFVASYILLWFVVLLTLVVSLATARQVAMLTRRFPFEDVIREPGPPVGEQAIAIEAQTIDGEPVALGPDFPRQTALVFMSDNCEACNERLPDLELIAREPDEVDLWLVTGTPPPDDHPLRAVLASRTLLSSDAFLSWDVGTVPYAFVIDPEGKIKAKGDIANIDRLRETLGLPIAAGGDGAGETDASHNGDSSVYAEALQDERA